MQWASKRARGRAGDDEFDGDGGRSPKRGTATWRRCRASGELWSGGEEEGVEAELLSWSGERGVVGDSGYGERRRRWCSAVRERARERREEPRESEREQGEPWHRPGHRARRGGQAGSRAGGVARWRARAPATLPSLCRGRRRQRREAGWAACWLGRPAGWAAQGGAQVSFSLLVFFLFSVLFNISATLLN